MIGLQQRRFFDGDDAVDLDEYRQSYVAMKEALVEAVTTVREKRANCDVRGAKTGEKGLKTAEEAIQFLCERDRREEDECIGRIRSILQKNWVIVKEEKDKPKGLAYFEAFEELLKNDIDDLSRGVVNAPCSCGEWQRALPDALSYPYDAADYYEVADGEDEPDIYNFTLANGTVVRLGRNLRQHPLAASIDSVRDLTQQFLTDALKFAKKVNSQSLGKWVEAVGCFNRVKHAYRMPQSRPLLEQMIDAMIKAMTTLQVEVGNDLGQDDSAGNSTARKTLKEKMGRASEKKGEATTPSPIPIGTGFPFIESCDPKSETFRMRIKRPNGAEDAVTFKIRGEERWHYVLQFAKAKKNRISLKPFRKGKAIDLSLVFRDNKGCNHVSFYRFTRTTGGSKARYWLEQTQLIARAKGKGRK